MRPHYCSPRQHSRGAVSMTALLFAALSAFLAWAALFEIEQTVRAQGQIIPSARTQVIQSADGGVLEKLLVEEGQGVTAGQQLAVLEREQIPLHREPQRVTAQRAVASDYSMTGHDDRYRVGPVGTTNGTHCFGFADCFCLLGIRHGGAVANAAHRRPGLLLELGAFKM